MYDLVAAVKGFSYMDRAPTSGPVDIRGGITDTLTMLGAKMRSKSVEVSVNFSDDLVPAHAVGAELNQVWMNLLDNALDAVAEGGRISVTAAPGHDCVTVNIIDDGPGIPLEIQDRIFDPFFTTKSVGKGWGSASTSLGASCSGTMERCQCSPSQAARNFRYGCLRSSKRCRADTFAQISETSVATPP